MGKYYQLYEKGLVTATEEGEGAKDSGREEEASQEEDINKKKAFSATTDEECLIRLVSWCHPYLILNFHLKKAAGKQ